MAISVKYHKKISILMCFVPPLKGFPLELGTCAGDQKTRMMGVQG